MLGVIGLDVRLLERLVQPWEGKESSARDASTNDGWVCSVDAGVGSALQAVVCGLCMCLYLLGYAILCTYGIQMLTMNNVCVYITNTPINSRRVTISVGIMCRHRWDDNYRLLIRCSFYGEWCCLKDGTS